ncbi:hypothetical protein [Rhodococcus opacus]|uniref:hypothetical protein n=1 Tax=Rhodococcus opacus TaxID=37919 RepID=UPI001C48D547|nr:hypothetical protein [Rhodococcus opacus]MBV6759822.1 hypothetical protein [Rhodococcus opacus]
MTIPPVSAGVRSMTSTGRLRTVSAFAEYCAVVFVRGFPPQHGKKYCLREWCHCEVEFVNIGIELVKWIDGIRSARIGTSRFFNWNRLT